MYWQPQLVLKDLDLAGLMYQQQMMPPMPHQTSISMDLLSMSVYLHHLLAPLPTLELVKRKGLHSQQLAELKARG